MGKITIPLLNPTSTSLRGSAILVKLYAIGIDILKIETTTISFLLREKLLETIPYNTTENKKDD